MKKDVVLDENKKDLVFIDEETYQRIKKDMHKKDDFFSEKEFEKIDVILT